MGKKTDKEFGSQADLVKNEAGPATKKDIRMTSGVKSMQGHSLSRTASRTSEFETVRNPKAGQSWSSRSIVYLGPS